mmetsp:Transcript_99791/g.271275  ORF Transcript_99791/g.271275 Transcript_99791/m.271275 type:complete len:267 (+) Transcript_99791:1135-1935(+)
MQLDLQGSGRPVQSLLRRRPGGKHAGCLQGTLLPRPEVQGHPLLALGRRRAGPAVPAVPQGPRGLEPGAPTVRGLPRLPAGRGLGGARGVGGRRAALVGPSEPEHGPGHLRGNTPQRPAGVARPPLRVQPVPLHHVDGGAAARSPEPDHLRERRFPVLHRELSHRRQRERLRGHRGRPSLEGARGLAPDCPGQGRLRGRARRHSGDHAPAGQRWRHPVVQHDPLEGARSCRGRRLHGQQALPRVVSSRHPELRLQHGGCLDRVPLQ